MFYISSDVYYIISETASGRAGATDFHGSNILMSALIRRTAKGHALELRRPRPEPAILPLAPDRVAFLGSAYASTGASEPIFVQSLCWPIMPTAWVALAQAWHHLSAARGEQTFYSKAKSSPGSWIDVCAPQLGAPFRGITAGESSVAAQLIRTPIRIAITIIESKGMRGVAGATLTAREQALSRSLDTYDRAIKVPPGRRACAAIVTRAQGIVEDQQSQQEFFRCRSRMPEAAWLGDMQFRTWKETIEPLPLELAHVVAESVVRHQQQEDVANPIFDALLTKLASDPFPFKRPTKSKRR